MLKIGDNIKKIRELKFLDRQVVADGVGISLKTYSNIENNLDSPRILILEKIAQQLNVSIFKLFNFDEKIVLNNNGKHVENFANIIHQNAINNKAMDLYEKLLIEKDLHISTLDKEKKTFMLKIIELNKRIDELEKELKKYKK